MASSTPDRPDDAPAPLERLVDSVAAQVEALDALVASAESTLCVFDVNLAGMGWNEPRRIAALVAFLRGSRDARMQMIVHDTRHLETACPRLLGLLRQWGAAVTIYRTGPEARHAMDPLTLADGRHFLHRFHATQPRAVLVMNDPTRTSPLQRRFDEIWATGEPGLTATVLGL